MANPPPLAVTAVEVQQHALPPQVWITVEAIPILSDILYLYRVHPDGSRHLVLTADPMVITTNVTVVDYHAPFNRWFSYVAEAGGLVSANSTEVYMASSMVWLISATDPNASMMIPMVLGPPEDYSYKARTASFEILNRSQPVVRAVNKRAAEQGSLTIRLDTRAERQRLKDLLADSTPVLLNTPWSDDDMGWKWVSIEDMTITNPYGHLGYPHRQIKLPYIEVAQPDVDMLPVWTVGQLAAAFSTIGQAAAAYADVRAMALNIRS